MKNHNSRPENCKIYSEQAWQKHGFIGVCVVQNDKVVAVVSQDIYSARCEDSVKDAEKYIINKVNKLYDS